MIIYNTMTRKKEEFVPADKNEAKIYLAAVLRSTTISISEMQDRFVFLMSSDVILNTGE